MKLPSVGVMAAAAATFGLVAGLSRRASAADYMPLAVAFIQSCEGLELNAYAATADEASRGIYTIGWGLTRYPDGQKVQPGDSVTRGEADAMLEELIRDHVKVHESKIPGWSQMSAGQKAAVISFGWNHGRNFFDSSRSYFDRISDALRNDWDSVPAVLLEYNLANGVVLSGLTKRRANEALLWKGEWRPSDGCYG